ncbi:helix-turn-helix domain-containing protein [Oceanospirillum sediminis]|uniref:Helix-turn-helix transcriptional regulator n=1 Tax=Oceanospirillum sediminis TaxID=2760088 RepID=A0A839IX68_9GAMM|nr:helix-turn-helix transcriptional regulator [Oceanospirillum sediminis]MBB1489214.1 helix-turn-helix transcriptional regulator [Oceanospirillum sediminis]
MALLQLTPSKKPLQPGQQIARIYERIQMQDEMAFKQAVIRQLDHVVAIECLYWLVWDSEQRFDCMTYSNSDSYTACSLTAEQIATLNKLPLAKRPTSLSQDIFPAKEQVCYISSQCCKTGRIHTLIVSVLNETTEHGKRTMDLLALFLPHLLQASTLQQLNTARANYSQPGSAYAICDSSGIFIEASQAFETILDQMKENWLENICNSAPGFIETDNILCRTQQAHGFICLEAMRLPDSFSVLTSKEKQVCFFLSKAFTNKAIAEQLGSSEKTIENQLTSIYKKSGVRSRAMLIHTIKDHYQII